MPRVRSKKGMSPLAFSSLPFLSASLFLRIAGIQAILAGLNSIAFEGMFTAGSALHVIFIVVGLGLSILSRGRFDLPCHVYHCPGELLC